MSAGLPYNQHISEVSAQGQSQTFAGSARDVYFPGSGDPQKDSASACRNALFLTDPDVDRERLISAKGTRATGTCEWITYNDKYRAWLNTDGAGSNDSTRLLWISGGPGKGKTMLSIFLTEELKRHTAKLDNAELVFLFCSSQLQHNTAVDMLRGLVHQIITNRPQLIKHALPYFETPERTQQTLSSFETLWIIFTKVTADPELGTMFCILDGLDECEQSSLRALLPRVVSLLSGGASSLPSGMFRLAIISRDIHGLQNCTRVRLDPDNDDKVVSDIERFVSARVRELSIIEGFNDDFRASVQTTLLERAEGTFLWVGYAMHELLQKQTCSEILDTLEILPSGLPGIYGRMLLRIPMERREISRAILRWVTLAARPLQLDELAAATSVQPISPRITVAEATRDAVALCGPILKIQEQEVSLVHQSARDYLLRKCRDSDAVLEQFRIEKEPGHLELAQKCLDCIAQSSFQWKATDMDAELEHLESTLLRYATFHWPQHAKCCATLAAKLISYSKLFYQKKSPLRRHWWKTYNRSMTNIDLKNPLPVLHMACILEIVPWVEAVLAKKSRKPTFHKRVDKRNVTGNTALHAATRSGSEALVQLLLDNGADTKTKDNDGVTALHFAVEEGSEVLVQLLLDNGADTKTKDNDGVTALHFAAAVGNEGVVRLLLANGADIKAKDKFERSALHVAATVGNEGVVRLLLANGADIKAKDKFGRSALYVAAEWGHEGVMRFLLANGADIRSKGDYKGSLLHSAARGGNKDIVQLLLDNGLDIETKDSKGWSVLQEAALFGNKGVVQLLLTNGADVEAVNDYGQTVLHLVALRGNDKMVQLLVESGADIRVKDMFGRDVLHSALISAKGTLALLQLLLDSGANIKTRDRDGDTLLHSAVWKSGYCYAMVKLLMDRGVDIKAKNDDGYTALDYAASKGNKALVQLLEDGGADHKAKDDDGRKVLCQV